MRTLRFSLIFLLVGLSSGCATIVAQRADVTHQINIWLDDHKYDKALSTIAAMAPEHPDYETLNQSTAEITRQREQFIKATLLRAKTFEPQQDWINALDVIQRALSRLPRSPELQAQADYYQQKRQARINNDEAAILIAKAEYIIDARPYHESKLYNAQQSFLAQQEFNKYNDEARLVSRKLYVIGQRYWQDNKPVQARHALTLSIKTADNELSSELLSEISNQQGHQLNKPNSDQQQKINALLPSLEREFNRQLQTADFVAAQITLNEIRALNFSGTSRLQGTLNAKKEERVQALISRGNTLYNSGHIQAAIEQWHLALALAPKNQTILQQLSRAEKFIDNLERWKAEP